MLQRTRTVKASFLPTRAAPAARGPGTFTAVTVLAIAVLVSVVSSIFTYRQVNAAFAQHTALDRANEDLRTVFRYQLDEESALRGYLASGQQVFLEPYITARPLVDPVIDRLQQEVQNAGLSEAQVLLYDLKRAHEQWQAQIGDPLVASPSTADQIERLQRGKVLTDRMGADFDQLIVILRQHAESATMDGERLLRRAALSTAALMLLFGVAAIVADVVRTRTQAALERDRSVTDTLQRAVLSGWDILPYMRVGTAYVSSTRGATVGGDIFDVHRIDEHRSLLLVADVSGKGLQAAVETAIVKYTMRAIAEDCTDPAAIIEKFNVMFLKSTPDLGAFISVFIGLFDERDMRLHYSSAGHSPVYLRRSGAVRQLAVTGPLVGLLATDTFGTASEALQQGDTLVLATDGITEARDTSGVTLGEDGAAQWIRDGPDEPQALADELVERVGRFAGGRIADDLALLIIQLAGLPSSGVWELGADRTSVGTATEAGVGADADRPA